MINYLPILVCLLLTVVPAHAQHLSARLETELAIGDDESAPLEYLFSGPRFVAADGEGRIYVADGNQAEIRVFDPEGSYPKSIGRRGEGPGEFHHVTSMTVTPDDALLVQDRYNVRITRFTDVGEEFTTHPFPIDHVIQAHWMGAIDEESYLFYFRDYSARIPPEEDKLLHELDADFDIVTSFATGDVFYDLSDAFLRSRPGSPSAFRMGSCGWRCVLVAPRFYEGVIFRFQKEAASWKKRRLLGYEPAEEIYREIDRTNMTTEDVVQFMQENSYTFASSGSFLGQIHNASRGIHQMSDGRIVHFTTLKEGDEWIHGVEVFAEDGTFLGYGPIVNLEPGDAQTSRLYEIMWIDEEDRFYMVDRMEAAPIVKRVQLHIEGLDG